jgi:hypothetical protein
MDANNVWVRTADLIDAGTPLVLDPKQIEPETAEEVYGVRHETGLVVIG